jgi:DNA processing protein
VVASGLDVVYPREHSRIWNQLGEHGLILSEFPPGTAPEKYKFPQRNRIIAALSSLVVVVESRAAGGSMSTVREAMNRDVPVTAVPGNPAMKSAEGTNQLIADGCQSVCSTDDVLVALNLGSSRLPRVDPRRPPSPNGRELLGLLADIPRTIDWLALATARHVTDVAIDLGRLEADGWAQVTNGWWEALTVRA